jgi:DNA-binding response OmpR family regulator
MKTKTILIAEDDAPIREGLVAALESEGYGTEAVANGKAALESWKRDHFALILLDVMMPEKSGYEVCREIRKTDTATPIIMLTAKGEEIDKVVGLELGADDYIAKPFGVRELLARIAAVLRRTGPKPAKDAAPEPPDEFAIGTAKINRKTYSSRLGKHDHPLTARELKLLELFWAHPHEVLSRDMLLNAAWGIDYLGTTRTLDQHIAQLRKKVEPHPDSPVAILTVHGVGYRYEP